MSFPWEENFLKQKRIKFLAGVDEAGRGPLAGPLVVAAVILKPEYRSLYFVHKIADSKCLTFKQRCEAFEEIIQRAWIGIGIVEAEVIDSTDISFATQFAAEMALTYLKKKPEYILTGAGINLSSAYPYLSLIHGERKSLSIACASIVAKVIRDRAMEVYDCFLPQYAFREHKGYGTRYHLSLLKAYGPSPIHRKSFSPLRDWCKG
ncbi:MAG: ribonuclease HII [Candidatus Omnitrophica bacterium]|nr:ribonuclease HII [Candidatus Omnitrophota bacterium]MCM8793364.1 ribonuclease HII [Candidatus Omnitrophota bacterium]